eukprot:CAMPEP_0174374470 /NCGR_PEP_ID=MMETSP0811_2-20130205/111041_1 /TAXON_ID=73025 ORGANISM="Eutreptiella gymnastica-like, Strain CCMP1594" /NCGR_SAMPLE_ID=MMETSP0811_2 /ASSEMBLY_ACC=CAM_ASM_000667 /LENGTH=132 /DNA_ID=CAMNT_0015523815 /DNA_START=155 /DNA_END=551 /DNA_ORIENTATION=+
MSRMCNEYHAPAQRPLLRPGGCDVVCKGGPDASIFTGASRLLRGGAVVRQHMKRRPCESVPLPTGLKWQEIPSGSEEGWTGIMRFQTCPQPFDLHNQDSEDTPESTGGPQEICSASACTPTCPSGLKAFNVL